MPVHDPNEQHGMLGGERIVPVGYDAESLLNRSGADLKPTTAMYG